MAGTWCVCLLLVGLCGAPTRGLPTKDTPPVVRTVYGDLRGIRDHHKGQPFDVFKGVGFAKPPVSSLRWERPQSPEKWTGVRDATVFGNVCSQRGNDGSSEDCLYLNVYIPDGVQNTLKSPLPIIVWVHGGGLAVGNGNMYRGQELALIGQVIVVTFNYRLDVLGGLSTADANLPGNYHLWDSRAALLWIRDNIKNFGGDPSRVTIAGQSSAKDAQSLIDSGFVSSIVYGGRLPGWLPVVDGQMLTAKPKEAWARGAARDIDYMIGSAEHDTASFVYMTTYGARGEGTVGLADSKLILELALRFLLQTYVRGDDVQPLIDAIFREYPDLDSDDVTARTKAVVQSTTDWVFASAVHREAQLHARVAKGKNTFMYKFRYRPSFVHYKEWITGSHNDDLHFTFGEPYLNSFRKEKLGNFSKEDIQLKEDMMHYFANFAHTGHPNKGPHKMSVAWPQYDSEEKQYMELSSQRAVKQQDTDLLRRVNFWINKWPKITVPEEPYRQKDGVPGYIKKMIQTYIDTMLMKLNGE